MLKFSTLHVFVPPCRTAKNTNVRMRITSRVWKMAHGSNIQNVVAEFSPNGAYFAYSDASGSLQIWETATRTRRQQYTPSAHLSESSSCISWAPIRKSSSDQVSYSFDSKLIQLNCSLFFVFSFLNDIHCKTRFNQNSSSNSCDSIAI